MRGVLDDVLKALADVAIAVSGAEEALAQGRPREAAALLDGAEEGLAALRARWPELGPRERRALGAAAAPVRRRVDDARGRLPRVTTLSLGVAEVDPEQEVDPAAA
jgi:hypothetical protein